MAFELAKVPYHFEDGYGSAIGHATNDDSETGRVKLCPSQVLHLGSDGKPLWYNGSLYRNKHLPKDAREWMKPTVWAKDTGKWQMANAGCMLNVSKEDGLHYLMDTWSGQTCDALQQIAMQLNAKYDGLLT